MSAHPAPRPPARTSGTPARGVVGVLVALVAGVLVLTGCDLRLESAPPAAPTPGAAELVRERTVADALALAAAARAAAPVADPAAGAVLADVAAFSTSHAAQLGGPYDPGGATPTSVPTAVVATPDEVLAALRADATAALAAAEAADDGATARLLAAVGTCRDQLATRLAAALNEPPAAPAATPSASPATAATSPAPGPTPSASAPAGAAGALAPLVLAHDQAGFGLEVIAAKLSGDARTAAATSAAAHRSAGQAWARRVQIAGTTADPRRADYAVPATVADPQGARALAASLESGVARAASAALVGAPAGLRADLVGEVGRATAAAATWGAAPTPFPGLPDLS